MPTGEVGPAVLLFCPCASRGGHVANFFQNGICQGTGACRDRVRRPAAAASRYPRPQVSGDCGREVPAVAVRRPALGFPGSREGRPAGTVRHAARAAGSGTTLTLRYASRSARRAGGPGRRAASQAACRSRLTAPSAGAGARSAGSQPHRGRLARRGQCGAGSPGSADSRSAGRAAAALGRAT